MCRLLVVFLLAFLPLLGCSQSVSNPTVDRQNASHNTSTAVSSKEQILDTVTIQRDIKALLKASTIYLAKNSESESLWDLFESRTTKIVALLTSIIALVVSFLAFFKDDFLIKYKPLFATIAVISFSCILALFFASFLQVIVFAAFAIALIFFMFLYLFLKYIEFFDRKGYGIAEKMLSYFDLNEHVPKDFITVVFNWLESILIQQISFEVFELRLEGSFIRGYDFTIFKIVPTVTEAPLYKVIDEKIIIPINIEITFVKGLNNEEETNFKNIQYNQLIITATDKGELVCNTFYSEGFSLLGLSLSKWMQQKMLEVANRGMNM